MMLPEVGCGGRGARGADATAMGTPGCSLHMICNLSVGVNLDIRAPPSDGGDGCSVNDIQSRVVTTIHRR